MMAPCKEVWNRTARGDSYPFGRAAVVYSMFKVNSIDHCHSHGSNGTFTQAVNDVRSRINMGFKVAVEFAVFAPNCSTGSTIPINKWYSKVKDLTTSIEKGIAASRYQKYWGGVVLDEEASFGYSPGQLTSLNGRAETYLDSHGGGISHADAIDVNLHWTSLTPQQYASIATQGRPMPQLYDPAGASVQMLALAESACRAGDAGGLACFMIPGKLQSTSTPPRGSSKMEGKTIVGWGSRDWWDAYTL